MFVCLFVFAVSPREFLITLSFYLMGQTGVSLIVLYANLCDYVITLYKHLTSMWAALFYSFNILFDLFFFSEVGNNFCLKAFLNYVSHDFKAYLKI